jgi:hypothetical protein
MNSLENINGLPNDIKQHILSYLYFSQEQSNVYNSINYIVTHYNALIYNALYVRYTHNQIYRTLLRWLNMDENKRVLDHISEYVEVIYEYNNDDDKEAQNMLIMREMSFFTLQKFYTSFISFI